MMRRNTFAQVLRAEVQDAAKISEEDVLAHYEQNKFADPRLSRPGYLTFSHVRTKTLDEANSALTRLKRGENINALARRVSIADDAARGGVARRHMYRRVERTFGKKFLEAVTAAKEGDLIGPVKMEDGGYEIVLKMDEVKPIPRPLEDVKDSIRARLERDERDKAYKNLLDSLEQAVADRIIKSPRLTEAEKARSEFPQGSRPPTEAKPAPARRARPRQKSN
ncbi:MAG: peptidyl-prolyl cis-trans isomerase [Planctomycetota bacterium]